MFKIFLADAAPYEARKWLTRSGIVTGSQGVASISVLVTKIKGILPEHLIIEYFTFMALAIALVTILPLVAFKKILSVSLAQLGFATSLIYLGFSLTGAFQSEYKIVITVILILVIIVFLILFYSGIEFVYRQKSRSDLFLNILLLLCSLLLWLYPIWIMWR